MKSNVIVYVAGPFRAPNSWEIEQNIRRAEELSLSVWRAGLIAICPHTNTRFFQGAADDSIWLTGDLVILSRCDALILVPGWESSSGTKIEIEHAKKNYIPIFENIESLLSWSKS